MSELQISSSAMQLSREEFEADCAWLHEYSDQVKDVMAAAQRGSMVAAAKITRVFESPYWVEEHLRTHPITIAHRRGQPVKPDSVARFTEWVQEHPDRLGDAYTRTRIAELITAHRFASEYLSGAVIYSDTALKPVRKYFKDRQAELPQIARRIRELSDGATVSAADVRRAIHDHQQSLIPAKISRGGRKTVTDHAAVIRAEFRILLNSKRFRDAGALLNELRAELMAAAGVTDEH